MATYNLGRVGLNFCGEYSENAAYSPLDVVRYNGNCYVAIIECNNGIAPANAQGETNDAYWKLMVEGFDANAEAELLTLSSSAALPPSHNGNGNLRYRVVGKHVYISGGVEVAWTGPDNLIIANLPDGLQPVDGNIYLIRAATTNKIARIGIGPGGSIFVNYVKNLSDSSDYNGAVWIDCNFDYWVD